MSYMQEFYESKEGLQCYPTLIAVKFAYSVRLLARSSSRYNPLHEEFKMAGELFTM